MRHLFVAMKVLPAPNSSASWVAVALITLGHVAVSILLGKLSEGPAGLVSLIFFFSAMGADLYAHFLRASANNVFMVAPGDSMAAFDASVLALLALEILGWLPTMRSHSGRTENDSNPKKTHPDRGSVLKMVHVSGHA